MTEFRENWKTASSLTISFTLKKKIKRSVVSTAPEVRKSFWSLFGFFGIYTHDSEKRSSYHGRTSDEESFAPKFTETFFRSVISEFFSV